MPVTFPAQEVKRRGMSVMNESLANGPVWVISNNAPKYVVMFADEFKRMFPPSKHPEIEYLEDFRSRT